MLMYPQQPITFAQLLLDNETEIRSQMRWENYTINETIIPVIELLKDDAISVLRRSYGKFLVEPDILDDVISDVFIYFPILMQQLAISRLLDAYAVNTHDLDTETTTRIEVRDQDTDQRSTLTTGTSITETNGQKNEQRSTGTVSDDNIQTNEGDSTTQIENSSGIEETGSRNVSLSHNMPEQSIDGTTGKLPVDDQGTPILKTSYIQNASENFNTTNPINNVETSQQQITNTGKVVTANVQTNDLTQVDESSGNRVSTNSGSDNSNSSTNVVENATVTESRELHSTNKQYAYEVKAFLEITGQTVAFKNWEDRFAWVVGIQ